MVYIQSRVYHIYEICVQKYMLSLIEMKTLAVNYGSSHPEVFCKKDALRNFTKFTGKHLCQSLFFNKVAD